MERKTESVKIGERAANPDNVTLRKAIADVWSSTLDIERVFSKVHSAGLSSSDLLVSRVTEVNKSLELELSSASFASLQSAIRRRRLEVRLSLPTKKNHRCIIFTAPHTLRLKRDSNMDHLPELETRLIASSFADLVGGNFVSWSSEEIDRIRSMRSSEGCRIADPTNRDPNYLSDKELSSSPWFAALHTARAIYASAALGSGGGSLLVDVHGMVGKEDDPVLNPQPGRCDCIFGTLAMERLVGRVQAERFRRALTKHVQPVLLGFRQEPPLEMMTHCPELCGDWGVYSGRNTLSQMGTHKLLWEEATPPSNKPFSCAVQIEMSRRLRGVLAKGNNGAAKQRRRLFVNALLAAFQDCLAPHPPSRRLSSSRPDAS